MIPVEQTKFSGRKGNKGNCFQAVVASLLELPLEEVPNFCEQFASTKWFEKFAHWLWKNHNLWPVYIMTEKNLPTFSPPRGHFVLAGTTVKGGRHAVVAHGDGTGYHIVHDPHPDKLGLKHPDAIILFVEEI
jgi:hypothetical protein